MISEYSDFVRAEGLRFEYKYPIAEYDAELLAARLKHLVAYDQHCDDTGHYIVRSLYFDDFHNTALYEKINGYHTRAKFRLRLYDGKTDFIRLEKKSKLDNMTLKESAAVTRGQCEKLISGDYDWLLSSDDPVLREFHMKLTEGWRPKTIIEYKRQVFAADISNLRITFDKYITSTRDITQFLTPEIQSYRVPMEHWALMEVKFDNFLPSHIKSVLQSGRVNQIAFSKYSTGRYRDIS